MRAFVTGGSGFIGRALIRRLRAEHAPVRALSRSNAADDKIRAAGGSPVRGDIEAGPALRAAMAGCDVVFHCAAMVSDWGRSEEFHQVNVEGTRCVVEAARASGVACLVYVSSDSVVMGGGPLVGVDETWAYPRRPLGAYGASKAEGERLVFAADSPGFRTVAVRPGIVWGRGDTSVLPQIVEAVEDGSWRWVSGGRFHRALTHVENVCEALLLAAVRGRGGQAYFVTDGERVEFRVFMTRLLHAHGVDPGDKEMPFWLACAAARAVELIWRVLMPKRKPPIRRAGLEEIGRPIILDDSKARRELGYVGRMSVAQGLAEISAPVKLVH